MKKRSFAGKKRLLVGILALTLLLSACTATGLDASTHDTTASSTAASTVSTSSTVPPTTEYLPPADPPVPYVIIQSGDGNVQGVYLPDLLSSNLMQNPCFETEQYLFMLDAYPSGWEHERNIYEKYDISVAYEGGMVPSHTQRDAHILISHDPFSMYLSEKRNVFCVIGWFEGTTELTVTFTDRATGEIADTLRYIVTYHADTKEYTVVYPEHIVQKENLIHKYYNGNVQLTSAALELPTEELIKVILASDYLHQIFDEDSYLDVKAQFNGMAELESRADAAQMLQKVYLDLNPLSIAYESVGRLLSFDAYRD